MRYCPRDPKHLHFSVLRAVDSGLKKKKTLKDEGSSASCLLKVDGPWRSGKVNLLFSMGHCEGLEYTPEALPLKLPSFSFGEMNLHRGQFLFYLNGFFFNLPLLKD